MLLHKPAQIEANFSLPAIPRPAVTSYLIMELYHVEQNHGGYDLPLLIARGKFIHAGNDVREQNWMVTGRVLPTPSAGRVW